MFVETLLNFNGPTLDFGWFYCGKGGYDEWTMFFEGMNVFVEFEIKVVPWCLLWEKARAEAD